MKFAEFHVAAEHLLKRKIRLQDWQEDLIWEHLRERVALEETRSWVDVVVWRRKPPEAAEIKELTGEAKAAEQERVGF